MTELNQTDSSNVVQNEVVQESNEANADTVENTNVVEESSTTTNEETPSAQASDPEHPAKQRIDRRRERDRQEIERLIQENEALKKQSQSYSQDQFQHPDSQNYGVPENMTLVDPVTGKYLTPGTPRYEALKLQMDMEHATQQRRLEEQQKQRAYYQREYERAFEDSLLDAADRIEDFEPTVLNAGLTQSMIDVAGTVPNGADFLYYLAKNSKEVKRIANLPSPYQQRQEVVKHWSQFNNRSNVTKAPPPVQPAGETAGTTDSFMQIASDPRALRNLYRNKK